MRWMVTLVVGMGVLIIVGVGVVGVTILHRAGIGGGAGAGGSLADVVLSEPSGTRLVGVSSLGDRLAVALTGGGPDRVAIVDLRRGMVVSHVSLKP